MNIVVLSGNLCRDPELRYSAKGTPWCRVTIAVSEFVSKEKGQETIFVPLTVFGKSAEAFSKYNSKGSTVLVKGRLSLKGEKQADGSYRNYTSVLVSNWEFAGGKKERSTEVSAPLGPPGPSAPSAEPAGLAWELNDSLPHLPGGLEDSSPAAIVGDIPDGTGLPW